MTDLQNTDIKGKNEMKPGQLDGFGFSLQPQNHEKWQKPTARTCQEAGPQKEIISSNPRDLGATLIFRECIYRVYIYIYIT